MLCCRGFELFSRWVPLIIRLMSSLTRSPKFVTITITNTPKVLVTNRLLCCTVRFWP